MKIDSGKSWRRFWLCAVHRQRRRPVQVPLVAGVVQRGPAKPDGPEQHGQGHQRAPLLQPGAQSWISNHHGAYEVAVHQERLRHFTRTGRKRWTIKLTYNEEKSRLSNLVNFSEPAVYVKHVCFVNSRSFDEPMPILCEPGARPCGEGHLMVLLRVPLVLCGKERASQSCLCQTQLATQGFLRLHCVREV